MSGSERHGVFLCSDLSSNKCFRRSLIVCISSVSTLLYIKGHKAGFRRGVASMLNNAFGSPRRVTGIRAAGGRLLPLTGPSEPLTPTPPKHLVLEPCELTAELGIISGTRPIHRLDVRNDEPPPLPPSRPPPHEPHKPRSPHRELQPRFLLPISHSLAIPLHCRRGPVWKYCWLQ